MKKVICILLLTCVIIGSAFAQKTNAAALDLFQLVKGFIATDKSSDFSATVLVASYERLLSPHYSIGANLDMYFLTFGSGRSSIDGNYFSVTAEGRYYPSSETLEKLFIGTTLGYSQLSIDGSTNSIAGGFAGLSTSLKIGYKIIITNGLFIEPSLAYVLQKTSTYSGTAGTPLGWNGGLRLGYMF